MPATVHRRWTLAEVRTLIDFNPVYTPRYELVDGELLVTLMPTPAHQRALGDLLVAHRGACDTCSAARATHASSRRPSRR